MADELPEGWTKHLAPTGHYYYNNKHTGESTYERPVVAAVSRKRARGDKKSGDRPRFKMPLAAPWVLVVCRSGRRFVHNTETKESVWSGPTEVMDQVAKLDKDQVVGLIAKARGLRLDEPVRGATAKENAKQSAEENAKESIKEEKKEVAEDDKVVDYTSSEEEDGDDSGESESEEDSVEFESDDEELSAEEKQRQFFELLTQLGADPYGTWDTERDRVKGLVDDPRYDVYDSHRDRREQFDAWAAAAIPTHRPATTASGDPVELFNQLLLECYNPKKHKFYIDFKRAMRKDDRFVAAAQELTDREREQLFREHKSSK